MGLDPRSLKPIVLQDEQQASNTSVEVLGAPNIEEKAIPNVEKPETKEEEAKVEEGEKPEESTEEKTDEKPEEKSEDVEKTRKAMQKRIDKLTRKNHELQNKLAEFERIKDSESVEDQVKKALLQKDIIEQREQISEEQSDLWEEQLKAEAIENPEVAEIPNRLKAVESHFRKVGVSFNPTQLSALESLPKAVLAKVLANPHECSALAVSPPQEFFRTLGKFEAEYNAPAKTEQKQVSKAKPTPEPQRPQASPKTGMKSIAEVAKLLKQRR